MEGWIVNDLTNITTQNFLVLCCSTIREEKWFYKSLFFNINGQLFIRECSHSKHKYANIIFARKKNNNDNKMVVLPASIALRVLQTRLHWMNVITSIKQLDESREPIHSILFGTVVVATTARCSLSAKCVCVSVLKPTLVILPTLPATHWTVCELFELRIHFSVRRDRTAYVNVWPAPCEP